MEFAFKCFGMPLRSHALQGSSASCQPSLSKEGGEMGYDDVVYRVPAKLDPDTGAFALHQVSPHHTLGLTLTLTWPSVNRTLRGKNRTSAPLGYGEATVTRLSGCVSS
eukprot:scaffold141007_cov19-Tisochrysis_lutea.AAC.1